MAFCTACEKTTITQDEHINIIYAQLAVAPSTLNTVSDLAGTATLTVTAGGSWSAKTGQSWCRVVPDSGGEGQTTVTVQYDDNTAYDERNTSITFTCGDKTKVLTLTQKQRDALLLTSDKVEAPAEGGTYVIELKSNVDYDIVTVPDDGWLRVDDDSRALRTTTISLTVDENLTGEKRTGQVRVQADTLTATVHVYQDAVERSLVLTQDEFIVPATGGVVDVELASSSNYTVRMPEVDWITESESRALSTYTHHYTVSANDTYGTREAQIVYISAADGAEYPVDIIQLQNDAIVMARSSYLLGSSAQELTLSVMSNVEFNIEGLTDWLDVALVESRGLDERQLKVTLQENRSGEPRYASILPVSGAVVQPVEFVQAGNNSLMRVRLTHESPTFFLPDWTGVDVFGSVDWGDGTVETLVEGLVRAYDGDGGHTVTVDMYGAETFTVAQLGDITDITVELAGDRQTTIEKPTIDKPEWN